MSRLLPTSAELWSVAEHGGASHRWAQGEWYGGDVGKLHFSKKKDTVLLEQSPEEGHKVGKWTGTSPLQRQAEEVGAAQPEEQKVA